MATARVFDLCSEMRERANDLECMLSEEYLRTKINGAHSPNGNADEAEDPTQKRAEQLRQYYEERNTLLRFQNDLFQAEMRLEATADKLRLLFGEPEPDALIELRFRGYFSKSIDAAVSNVTEIDGPEATDASRDLGRNYLIKEKKYPFGPIFTKTEILDFSKSVWQAMNEVYHRSTQ